MPNNGTTKREKILKDDTVNRILQLVESVRSGENEASFDELLEFFSKTVFSLSTAFNLPEAELEDVRQEGRMALYRAAKSYDASRGVKFTTYAAACMSNAMLNFVKRYNADRLSSGEMLELDADKAADSETTEGVVFSEQLSDMLCKKGFAGLSENERNVLVMKLSGLKTAQISKKTGKSPKSVDNTLFRAREKLRRYLELGDK